MKRHKSAQGERERERASSDRRCLTFLFLKYFDGGHRAGKAEAPSRVRVHSLLL